MRRRLAPVEGSRETLQGFVPEEEETRTMQIIGSRLGDNVDDAGAGPAHLGGEFVGGDLKLCHSILWEIGQRSADDFVIVIAAVNTDVPSAAEGAGRGDLQGVCFRRIKGGCGSVTRDEVGQL